jgi:VanZ family protein
MKVKKVVAIIVVILWMSIVFYFSNQQGEGSSKTSSNVAKIIVNMIDIKNEYTNQEKEELIQIINPYIRKLAHYTIYAIGGIVISQCVYLFYNKEKIMIYISTVVGVLYAISDELHQLIIAGRSGKIQDVLIDSIGILTGIALFLLARKICNKLSCKRRQVRSERI